MLRFCCRSYYLVTGPLEILVCLLMIWRLVGLAVLGAVSVLFLSAPLNVWASKKGERVFERQMAAKDDRMRLTSEALAGIKGLKLYGWEQYFMDGISKIRNMETNLLR